MNRGYLYFALSITCLLLTWQAEFWWLRAPLIWVALAGLFFGAGYLSGYGELLRKSAQGRVPWWVKVVLLPVFVGITIYHLIARRLDPAPPLQRIRPGLWLGRRLTVSDRQLFEESKVAAVLDVTAEFDAPASALLPASVEYYNIPVLDRARPRLSQLVKAVKWISRQRARGREVLVHCALGQGRSVTVLLGYLMFEDPTVDPLKLLREIQRTRKTASPNLPQIRLLKRFGESTAIHDKPTTRVIFNPVSGNRDADQDREEIKAALSPFLNLSFAETTPETSAGQLTREALADDVNQVIAAGGDGTVAAVASELAGTSVPLGIIPRGTANALAVCLYGGSVRLDAIAPCAHHILTGLARSIDIAHVRTEGEKSQRTMLQLAGIGIEQGMVERAERDLKNRYGALAYLVGGYQQMVNQAPFRVRLTIDDEMHEFETGSVTIANAAPKASMLAQGGNGPQLDDGLLDVTVVTNVDSKADALGVLRDLLLDTDTPGDAKADGIRAQTRNEDDSNVWHRRGKRIRIETDPPQKMVVDGEVGDRTPATFEVNSGALQVLVDPETEV